LVVTTIVSVFTVGTMDTTYSVALVGLVAVAFVGHVAGSPCVPRSSSICWDTGIAVAGSPTVAF
jgi:hypothetical protein